MGQIYVFFSNEKAREGEVEDIFGKECLIKCSFRGSREQLGEKGGMPYPLNQTEGDKDVCGYQGRTLRRTMTKTPNFVNEGKNKFLQSGATFRIITKGTRGRTDPTQGQGLADGIESPECICVFSSLHKLEMAFSSCPLLYSYRNTPKVLQH